MGKSPASCFKIIACGSDSVDHDDLQVPERKGSSDRRGWSFGKRSARHRVLSNSVISETPSMTKENPESVSANFQAPVDLAAPAKNSVIQWTEEKTPEQKTAVEKTMEEKSIEDKTMEDKTIEDKTMEEKTMEDTMAEKTIEEKVEELPDHYDSNLSHSLATREDNCRADDSTEEPSAIIIQAAIRGLLAQRVLLKQKNIIKLQAAVRGHLVRNQAIGTLRCVQAIIKMQALVRARHARLHVEGFGSGYSAEQRESSEKDDNNLILLSKKEAKRNDKYTYVSIEKLLNNAFARQLMDATPRTKRINIKCEPSKSDSAWNWLERWMSVSSVGNEAPHDSGSDVELHKEHCRDYDDKEEILVLSDQYPEPTDIKSGLGALAEASENDDCLISHDTNNIDLYSSKSISPSSSHSNLHFSDQSNSRSELTESAPIEMKETSMIEVVEMKSLPEEETGNLKKLPDLEKFPTEQHETEVKKISKKASNPAFIAAQSKFEELSSAPISAKSATSYSEPGTDSDQPSRSRDSELADNAILNASAVHIVGSECGTELSVSSTLDSPDRSEVVVNHIDPETKASDETDHPRGSETLEHEANEKSIVLEADASCTSTDKLDRYESIGSATGESLISMVADSPKLEKKQEADPSNLQLDLGSEASHQVSKSSPGGSPRSHVTVPESQATPSSQVSVKTKKTKREKSEPKSKKKIPSAEKNVSNRNQDSASRSSLEQLQEHKTGKRRNSFGSAKPDHREQEPRDSSSSNSLPSYMQATESAKAKAIANGSPRSSPDVHEKDLYIKKRHSLPGTNERQGSPRIERSQSQAQQIAKGNGNNSPQGTQERKWRR